MSRQLPLALGLQDAPGIDDFIVGRNRQVIDALQRLHDPEGESLLYLFGPAGSGRSHLLLAKCAEAGQQGLQSAYLDLQDRDALAPEMLEGLETLDLVAVDDVQGIGGDDAWEQALFTLFNRCRDRGTAMIFSADQGPARLPIRMPDLRTRLAWGLTLAVQGLDDEGRLGLLKSLAGRRGLKLPDEVARYLIERTARDAGDLVKTIERLDRASLAERRRLTIPFVREILDLG